MRAQSYLTWVSHFLGIRTSTSNRHLGQTKQDRAGRQRRAMQTCRADRIDDVPGMCFAEEVRGALIHAFTHGRKRMLKPVVRVVRVPATVQVPAATHDPCMQLSQPASTCDKPEECCRLRQLCAHVPVQQHARHMMA